jgi:hypothetical protein
LALRLPIIRKENITQDNLLVDFMLRRRKWPPSLLLAR